MASLIDLARSSAREHGAHAAIVFQGRTTTHAQFDHLTDRVAAGLAEKGVAPGDRIALYCVNSDAFALAYFGILKAGATVVPINLLLNHKEVAYILNDAGAKGLIYFEAFVDSVKSCRLQVASCRSLSCWPARRRHRSPPSRPIHWPPSSTPPAPPAIPRARC